GLFLADWVVARCIAGLILFFFFSSRRRHTRFSRDWSSDVSSSDLRLGKQGKGRPAIPGEPEGHRQQKRHVEPETTQMVGTPRPRSEERRVGKECRSRWSTYP